MSVKVTLDITKKDTAVLARLLEYGRDSEVADLAQKILRKTHEVTGRIVHEAEEVMEENPFSVVCMMEEGREDGKP